MAKSVRSETRRRNRYAAPVRRFNFPAGFAWGAATSAGQIEGATAVDGRGESIWEEYFRVRPHLDNGEIACDHYRRMPEDVGLMKKLGLTAYRFSVAWPRVIPQGAGKANPAGLDFYDRLVDQLLKAEIEPYLTLYHWDLPQALEVKGGWLNRDTTAYFADYSALMIHRLGDRVKKWATFNEPEVIVAGYIGTGLAPGLDNPKTGAQVGHNLLVAHGKSVQAMRSIRPDIDAGMVLNLVPVEPENESAAEAARRRWDVNYGWYLDALFTGTYPADIWDGKGWGEVSVEPGDMALIAQRLDFLGINYYLRMIVDERGDTKPVPGATLTQMGWEIYPQALGEMLVDLNRKYDLPPVYITENGAALDDTVESGRIKDEGRTKYLHDHLAAVEQAVISGVDVRGYFAWSLMDNLEWSLGYSKTFGLIHVDRKTLKRTIKESGLWYRDLIARNTDKARSRRSA